MKTWQERLRRRRPDARSEPDTPPTSPVETPRWPFDDPTVPPEFLAGYVAGYRGSADATEPDATEPEATEPEATEPDATDEAPEPDAPVATPTRSLIVRQAVVRRPPRSLVVRQSVAPAPVATAAAPAAREERPRSLVVHQSAGAAPVVTAGPEVTHDPGDDGLGVATGPTLPPPPRRRGAVLAALVAVAVLVVALVAWWRPGTDEPVSSAATEAVAAPVALQPREAYVRSRVTDGDRVEVEQWIDSPGETLTLSLPEVGTFPAGVAPTATDLEVRADGEPIGGPDALTAGVATWELPRDVGTVEVTYAIDGAVRRSSTAPDRALVWLVALRTDAPSLATTTLVEGAVVRALSCLPPGTPVPVACGAPDGEAWRVQVAPADRETIVMAQVDLG